MNTRDILDNTPADPRDNRAPISPQETRLLLAQPRIMLLDEPTASMDIQLEARVMKHLFEDIAPTSVLVVVTHKMGLLPHVNRIIVVDKGRIVADGPREQILARMNQGRPKPVTTPEQAEVAAA